MLHVGDKFDSFKSFNEKLEEYKKKVYSDFWIRDCRTLKNHAKKYPNSCAATADSKLMYYYVRFACIKGGRAYTPRNKLRKTFTFRQDCKSGFFLKLTACGKYLEIKELCEEHSHTVSEALFRSLPQQRLKIPEKLKLQSKDLLNARGNKKIVQNKIIQESGCYVTLKDLTNLNRKPESKKKFDECVDILKNIYNCDVQILLEEDHLKCLYFQDVEMKRIFASYPEMIFVDGTYCLHESRAATYIIMVENSEGHGEVVCVGILMDESQENIEWFVQTFKNLNPLTAKTNVIMSDKDSKERQVFKKLFPNASLQICLFHTLQIFNREVSHKKMGLTTVEAQLSKSVLQKLAYAKSETEFNRIYSEMKNNEQIPQVVIDYFEKYWEPIKSEWVLYLTLNNMCFLNKTNNKVENINHQLKSVISRYSSLEDFIKHFFIVLNSLRVDRNIKQSAQFHKVSTQTYGNDSPQNLYQKYLTNYAFQNVENQFKLMSSVNQIDRISTNLGLVQTSEGLLQVTSCSCECLFRCSMSLPCRHILKFREICDLPLFDKNLCLKRWSRSYFFEAYGNANNLCNENAENEVYIQNCSLQHKPRKPLTNHQKFKLMNDECLKLSQISSETSTSVFYQRLDFIKRLYEKWSENRVCSSFTCDSDNSCDTNELTDINSNIGEISETYNGDINALNSSQSLDVIDSLNIDNYVYDFVYSETTDFQTISTDNCDNGTVLVLNNHSENVCSNTNVACDQKISDPVLNKKHDNNDSCCLLNDELADVTNTSDITTIDEHDYCSQFSLSNIKIPRIKMRGRPKGLGNTVIGLKRSRK